MIANEVRSEVQDNREEQHRDHVLEFESHEGDARVQILVNRCDVQCHKIIPRAWAEVIIDSAKRRMPETMSAATPAMNFRIQTLPG